MKIKQRILKAILHKGAMSRAELSAELGISPSRISEVSGLMIDEGLIIIAGYGGGNGRGRKNILLDIETSRRFALGIGFCQDIVCAGITTVKGETIESRSISLASSALPDDISCAAKKLCLDIIKNCCLNKEQLLGVGICQDSAAKNALKVNKSAKEQMDCDLPILIEPAEDYLEYSSAYIPINPAEMYMFGCAKVIRDVFLGDS